MTESSNDAKYVITNDEIGRIRSIVIEDATHPYETGMIERIISRPAPESCDNTCIYKRFSQNMKNAEKHDEQVRSELISKLQKTVAELYDCGFRNPMVTLECAIEYLEIPTVIGHPEQQKQKRKGAP